MTLRFGIFDQMDRNDLALSDFYEGRLKLAALYDELGYDGLFVSEHHSTPLGMSPSPSVFFSAVAQRTQRLRFGPLVYCLPLYEPLRLIEEICMLDHMSGGRLEVGVGKGISPFEVGYFNVDHGEALQMYIEAFDVIRQGLTQPVLDHQGKYYSYTGVPMELAPAQRPHPPFWYGLVNPETIPWAAENAINIVSYPPPDEMAGLVARYQEEWAKVGASKPMPATALGRHIHIADTTEAAHREAKEAWKVWWDALQYLWIEHGTISEAHPEDMDEMIDAGRVIVGTVDHVRDEVVRQITVSGANYFIGRFAFGNLTLEQSSNTARLFAEHVIPAAQAAVLTRAA
jgi:alkanesulfonate monooxygenase SsuD/methylene tetrahydromethanopterin reductase-like flavin-dependent oxidoreductase (luciferase family)